MSQLPKRFEKLHQEYPGDTNAYEELDNPSSVCILELLPPQRIIPAISFLIKPLLFSRHFYFVFLK